MTTPESPIKRPRVYPEPVTWKAAGKVRIPGIGLRRGSTIQAHLTPDEARAFADKLHDMADQIDAATSTQKEIH